MRNTSTATADVFSAQEIARAAGVPARAARELIARGRVGTLDGRLIGQPEAVRAVRLLLGADPAPPRRELFEPPPVAHRPAGGALAASGAMHATTIAVLALLTTLGIASRPETMENVKQMRLVFLATPGPGGGGGGGGLRQPRPPQRAELKGVSLIRSPVPRPKPLTTRKREPEPRRTPPPPVRPPAVERPVEPPPPAPRPEVTPQVVAPVVTAAADTADRAGTLTDSTAATPSQGPGSGGGAGTGTGTGLGEGDGSGIGPGSGGGTGGGPFRPGSGITPPQVLREVRPDYTQDARRRGIEGDVVLEIVVRRDGGVGDVRLLQGLGAGLDQRAIEAVRQWRFSPARRHGTPVDVIVEVAVEFKLR
jgi:TonB family protein